MNTDSGLHDPHAMPEGEEPPPPGVTTMAWVRWILIAALGLLATYSVISYLHARDSGSGSTQAAVRYHCPMHPQIVSDKPGECPICGMDLVPIPDVAKTPEPTRFHCPMHPQVVSDKKDECPICGMDLVPIEEHAAHEPVPGLAALNVPEERIQRIGVRTAKAEMAALADTVRTLGVVVPSEARTAHVHTRFNGWVEQLMVRETGAPVKKGQPLAAVYSPEVLQAQQDLIVAGQAGLESLRTQMRASARSRLRLLGLTDGAIEAIQESGKVQRTVTLYSPMEGIVNGKAAIEGIYVTADTDLFEIADLSVVWLMLDIREDQMARVQVGQQVNVEFAALPGAKTTGKLSYLYPSVDPLTRTLKARVEVANPKLHLRPGMYGTAEIALTQAKGVVVPAEAVVQTGTQSYVFVAKGGGAYEPRSVKIGTQTPDRMVLASGVEPGEEVVTSALFLLDSESRLRAALNPAKDHAGHQP